MKSYEAKIRIGLTIALRKGDVTNLLLKLSDQTGNMENERISE